MAGPFFHLIFFNGFLKILSWKFFIFTPGNVLRMIRTLDGVRGQSYFKRLSLSTAATFFGLSSVNYRSFVKFAFQKVKCIIFNFFLTYFLKWWMNAKNAVKSAISQHLIFNNFQKINFENVLNIIFKTKSFFQNHFSNSNHFTYATLDGVRGSLPFTLTAAQRG